MGSVRERLESILEAQRWGGPEGCALNTPAYICLGFWLSDADLESIRPNLRRDQDYPDVGEVGRYRSVPVWPASESPAERSPWGLFEGVWFAYLPCQCVD